MTKSKDLPQDKLYQIRHGAAHVMAQAVIERYPAVKIAIGPPIDTGFYYDFDLGREPDGAPRSFSTEDLEAIERRMRQIIAGNHAFAYREVSEGEARELFADQPYKLELIDGLTTGRDDDVEAAADASTVISTYKHDTFEDLCRGPHLEHTGQIPSDAFKLMTVAGAYWRGDESRGMLQRIYGTAWKNKKGLKAYLKMLEEAKKRDHRKLGRELEIYIFEDEVGPGLPLWLPRGTVIIEELERLAKEVEHAAGYQRVRTPHLTKESLFYRSGHLPYYEDSMYPPMEMEGIRYFIKPMNCPFHHKIYGARPRSYRELPLRLAEYGTCYRYEKSGELFGLMRVRSMQMNDAHIYCSEEQFDQEFMAVVDMYRHYFELFGIEKFEMRLSTHHENGLGKKYVDNRRLWLKTEEMVRQAMIKGQVPFEEEADEAAFYGPKIDVQIWSAIGREFTLATNQVDFAQPESFDLTYVNDEGAEIRPLCIHRAPLSTHERFIGFLIEHYAGKFPVWLAPEQLRIVPITDNHNDHCLTLARDWRARGIRGEVDTSSERMNAKIRNAQLMQVPYMAVIGDQEMADGTVSLRKRDGSRQNGMPLAAFEALLLDRIATRSSEL